MAGFEVRRERGRKEEGDSKPGGLAFAGGWMGIGSVGFNDIGPDMVSRHNIIQHRDGL